MPSPANGPLAHARRVAEAHDRATGRLREWVCWEPSCSEYGASRLTRRDPGAELAEHYLERHYRPPAPTPRRVPPRDQGGA